MEDNTSVLVSLFDDLWLVVPPVLLFVYLVLRLRYRHRARMAALELLKSSVAGGAEPPSWLLRMVETGSYLRTGDPMRRWLRVVVSAALALGFAVEAFTGTRPWPPDLDFVAWALGCAVLAVGFAWVAKRTPVNDAGTPGQG